MNEALEKGIHLHQPLMSQLVVHIPDEEEYMRIARFIDDLIAAAVVETLERCTTYELRFEEIRQIREKFEARWMAHPSHKRLER